MMSSVTTKLHPSIIFKDLNEITKIVNLHFFLNSKPVQWENDKKRLKYKFLMGCAFVLLISQDDKGLDFKVKH